MKFTEKLGSAFNTSPQYWLNIDNDYRLWLAQKKKGQTEEVKTKAVIYSRMPVRDMIKKGWLKNPMNLSQLIKEVKEFWDISSLDFRFIDKLVLPCFKKSDAYNVFGKLPDHSLIDPWGISIAGIHIVICISSPVRI